jgi:hypothetical protein
MTGRFARFAVHESEVRRASGKMHPKLFSPPRNRKLSVELVAEDTNDKEIASRGVRVARRREKEALYGWAILAECVILRAGLAVNVDHRPKNHANITGWPENRRERKLKEKALADACQPRILETPMKVTV